MKNVSHFRYVSSHVRPVLPIYFFFFFNDTATTEIYTLSLHDALPIFQSHEREAALLELVLPLGPLRRESRRVDRKSTRLNSSHGYISYAVFCLKKKKISEASPEPPNDTNAHIAHNSIC